MKEIIKPINGYKHINEDLYNPYLTYEQNNRNGCNMPELNGELVIIYDADKPRYFIGRITPTTDDTIKKFTVFDSFGNIYTYGVDYIYWKEFEKCE